jgi:hypothetical protein
VGSGWEKAVGSFGLSWEGKEKKRERWCCVTCVQSGLLWVNKWGWVGQHGTGLISFREVSKYQFSLFWTKKNNSYDSKAIFYSVKKWQKPPRQAMKLWFFSLILPKLVTFPLWL